MAQQDDYYAILQLSPGASVQEVRQRYRQLALTHHPDRGGDASEFNRITKAYEVLSDPKARERYDAFGVGRPSTVEEEFRESFFGDSRRGMTVMEERRERERRRAEEEFKRQMAEDFQGLRVIDVDESPAPMSTAAAFMAATRERLLRAGASHQSEATTPAAGDFGADDATNGRGGTSRAPAFSWSSSADVRTPVAQNDVASLSAAVPKPATQNDIANEEPVSFRLGDEVELHGIKVRPEMNGLTGTIVNEQGGRWHISMHDGSGDKLIRSRNLRHLAKVETSMSRALGQAKVETSARPGAGYAGLRPRACCIVGSWLQWRPSDMNWQPDRSCFTFVLQLGANAKASFQIWLESDSKVCLYPDKPDSHYSEAKLCGPDKLGHGKNWTIGTHAGDKACPGARFEVQVHFAENGVAKRVIWQRLDSGTSPATSNQKAPTPPSMRKAVEGDRAESAAQLGVPTVEYKVMHDVVVVRRSPSLTAPDIGRFVKGTHIKAIEETFDGWVKLDGRTGWIIKDMRGRRGLHVLLAQVKTDVPVRLAVAQNVAEPGPLCFEVVFGPQVVIRASPSKDSAIRGFHGKGARVLGESQTYNGWVRLADGTGWMLSYDVVHGDLLRWCDEVADERRQPATSATIGNVNQAKLQSDGNRVTDVRRPSTNADAAGGPSSRLQAASQDASDSHSNVAERSEMPGRAVDETETDRRRRPSEELGGEAPSAQDSAGGRASEGESAEQEERHHQLLDRLASAASSGDAVEVKRARDEAKRGGVPTKEIARVFALYSRNNEQDDQACPAAVPSESLPTPPSPPTPPDRVEALATPGASGQAAAESGDVCFCGDAVEASVPQVAPCGAGGVLPAPGFCDEFVEAALRRPFEEGGPLDGEWVNLTGEAMATIRGSSIFWADGPCRDLRMLGDGQISTELFGNVFNAEVDPEGRLVWSDGDVWTRSTGDAGGETA